MNSPALYSRLETDMAREHKTDPVVSKPSAKPSINVSSVVTAIRHRALPWIEQGSASSIIIPRLNFEAMKPVATAAGLEISHYPLHGRRVPSRERSSGFQSVSARWPEEKMETKLMPLIACTIKGTADMRFNDYMVHCKEGTFLFIPAGVAHEDGSSPHLTGEWATQRSCDLLWLCPMGDVFKVWICRSEKGKHYGLPSLYLDQKNLCLYLDALFEQLGDKSPVRWKIRQGLLVALLASVLQEIEEGHFFRWLPQTVDLSADEERDPIKRAHTYIRQHMAEPLTTERVARYLFMSRSQFARKFNEQTGETFYQFLTRCRLEEAKLRLSNSTTQIAGIGRHVGLKPRQFNHLFRQHTGVTPKDYRRSHSVDSTR